MTTILPQPLLSDLDALRAEVKRLTAGLAAVVDELAERKVAGRRNYGYYPPTADELARIDADVHTYWRGVADAATPSQTGGVA